MGRSERPAATTGGSWFGMWMSEGGQARNSSAFRQKHSFPDQPRSQNHRMRIVQAEKIDRYAADGRSTDDSCTYPTKMAGPPLAARVEQSSEPLSSNVDAGDVRPLVLVAVHAGQSEV